MIVSPEHKALQLQHQALVLRMAQQDIINKKKDDQNALLASQITPLKNFIEDLKLAFENVQAQNELLIKTLEQKDKQLDKLSMIEHQYEQLKKMMYGRSSEKSGIVVNPNQLLLGMDTDIVEACNINDAQKVSGYTKYKPTNENHPGRNDIPKHIHREYVDMHPDGLPEGAEKFDVIETEQLEYDPARIFATVYRRHKYKLVKPDGTTEFFIAPLPPEKDKCLAAPSLKAYVTIDKYLYHMPIHRQRQKLLQHGIDISENTMGGWINNTCHSLTAIYDCLRKDVVYSASQYMMADETGITVLDKEKIKGKKVHQGYMWAYCNPVDDLVFFEYQPGRGNKNAKSVLGDFRGKLQADGYGVYKHYGEKKDIDLSNCNSHARRKFDEVKFTDKARANYVLEQYARLYAIEKYCRENDLNFDQRKEIRQAKSVPIFEELAAWIKEQLTKVTTLRSPIGKALVYFSSREKELGKFLHDGMLEIDTNRIENTIRPIALGRNNYLFAGSHDAAQNAAIIYSLIATCKLHGINPYDWLKYVLTVMPTHPANRIQELLPQNWKGSIS